MDPKEAEKEEILENSQDLHSAIVRLRAENECLKEQVEQRNRGWSAETLLQPASEHPEAQQEAERLLKRQLLSTLQRRSRLEQAVRARHEGLQRALCSSSEFLQQALADGAAAVEAEFEEANQWHLEAGRSQSQSRRPPSPANKAAPRRSWGASEILAVEQLAFDTSLALCDFAHTSDQQWAQQLALRFQSASIDLLHNVRALPPQSDPSTLAGALRRKLRRHLPNRQLESKPWAAEPSEPSEPSAGHYPHVAGLSTVSQL